MLTLLIIVNIIWLLVSAWFFIDWLRPFMKSVEREER